MTENDRLARLLVWQAKRYTSDSSMPAETAQELLSGLRYTLSMAPASLTASDDPEALWRAGLAQIESALALFKRLYSSACLGAKGFGNLSYRETLRSIGGFERKYDRLYFPHLVPCDIDYQLCAPVPDELAGVSYINRYLRNLCIENAFLSRFDAGAVQSVLQRSCPDYRGLLINLYEPVAANALALALLGGDPAALEISPGARRELTGLISPLPDAGLRRLLTRAAASLSSRFSLDAAQSIYLARAAASLAPRLEASAGAFFEGVFV